MPLPFHHHQQPPPSPTPLATLLGHNKEVRSVAWSPDGSLLASCGEITPRVSGTLPPRNLVTLHEKGDAEVWGLRGRRLVACWPRHRLHQFRDAETGHTCAA